jgi:hypothetical protein
MYDPAEYNEALTSEWRMFDVRKAHYFTRASLMRIRDSHHFPSGNSANLMLHPLMNSNGTTTTFWSEKALLVLEAREAAALGAMTLLGPENSPQQVQTRLF